MSRTDLFDTKVGTHRERLKMLRTKTPEWRLQKSLELTDWSRQKFPDQTRTAIKNLLKAS